MIFERIGRIFAPKAAPPPCIGNDPSCPCQDGDACHYRDAAATKAFPIPEPEVKGRSMVGYSRRHFFGMLGAAAAASVVVPEVKDDFFKIIWPVESRAVHEGVFVNEILDASRTGLTFYDLEGPAKLLYPVLSPLKRQPARSSMADGFLWKATI